MLTIKSEWAEAELESPPEPKDDKFMCLMNAIFASNLKEHGIGFGFIGNEPYPVIEAR
jgi:hypothetical protein